MRQEPLLRSAREQERIDTDEENAQKRARRTETETEEEEEEEEEEERESFTTPQARCSQFVRTTTIDASMPRHFSKRFSPLFSCVLSLFPLFFRIEFY